jgi:hypothetical protein
MKKYQKILIIIGIIVPVILLAGFIFIYTWEGSPKKIVAVADQFQAPASWELTSEQIRPPRISCWDGGGCPQVHKVWETNSKISKEEFRQVLQESGWEDFQIEKECELPQGVSGSSVSTCSTHGIVDDYNVNLWLSINSSLPEQQKMILSVRPMN